MVASAPFVPKRGRLAFTCDILAVWIDKTETEREKSETSETTGSILFQVKNIPAVSFCPGFFHPRVGWVSGRGWVSPQPFHLSSRLVRTAAPRESRSGGGAHPLGCATRLRRGASLSPLTSTFGNPLNFFSRYLE